MATSRELAEQAFSLLQNAIKETEAKASELDAELKKKRTPKNQIEQQIKVLEHRLETIQTESESWQREVIQQQEILENERAKARQLKKKLEVAESGPDKVGKKEVNYWRARAEQFDADTEQYKRRIVELKKELKTAQAESGSADTRVDEQIQERDAQLAEQSARIAALDAEVVERERRIEELAEAHRQLEAERQSAQARQSAFEAEAAERERRIEEIAAERGQVDAERQAAQDRLRALETEAIERERRIDELSAARDQIEAERQAAQDRLAALESELKQEAECTINLSEIANERREQITELSEKLDEALERYEEAKWHLERASRFERLVNKRRKLIDSLLEGLRAKQKSNTALKAGLDGLRKFKAKSEEQQQKLLVRIEDQSSELRAIREKLAANRKSDDSKERLREATETVAKLEEKLNTQADMIAELETELASARAEQPDGESHSQELAKLKADLAARNETISELEAEANALREQAEQSQSSDSETLRLSAVQEQHQKLIDDLKLENDSLKAKLREQVAAGPPAADGDAAAEVRKRDSQIADLKRRLKDQDKEISKLNEVATGWQRKYEFVTAEQPAAYQSVAVEK